MFILKIVGFFLGWLVLGGFLLLLVAMMQKRSSWTYLSGHRSKWLWVFATDVVATTIMVWMSTGGKLPTLTSPSETRMIPEQVKDGFWVPFAGLSIVIVTLAIVIILLIAVQITIKSKKRNSSELFWGFFWNNNTPLSIGMGATLVTLVIALYSEPGPSPVLPADIPTPGQRDMAAKVWHQLWHGTNAPAAVSSLQVLNPTKPLPWATGTWFWWKACGFYAILTVLYIPVGLWDEAARFCEAVKGIFESHRRKREEKELHATVQPVAATTGGAPAVSSQRPRIPWWQLLTAELAGEIISSALVQFIKHK